MMEAGISKPSTTAIMKTVRKERLEVTGFFSSWDAIIINYQKAFMARKTRYQYLAAKLQLMCCQSD